MSMIPSDVTVTSKITQTSIHGRAPRITKVPRNEAKTCPSGHIRRFLGIHQRAPADSTTIPYPRLKSGVRSDGHLEAMVDPGDHERVEVKRRGRGLGPVHEAGIMASTGFTRMILVTSLSFPVRMFS